MLGPCNTYEYKSLKNILTHLDHLVLHHDRRRLLKNQYL